MPLLLNPTFPKPKCPEFAMRMTLVAAPAAGVKSHVKKLQLLSHSAQMLPPFWPCGGVCILQPPEGLYLIYAYKTTEAL